MEIRNRAIDRILIEGTDTSFNENLKTAGDYNLDKMGDYKKYIGEFFEFYRRFDFTEGIICPFSGAVVPRNMKKKVIKEFWDNREAFGRE
jgi:hypothetical protein